MDIRLLDGDVRRTPMSVEALISVSSRRRRKEAFYRSLVRCFSVTLLFIAFGCFFAIYRSGGKPYGYVYSPDTVFDARLMLKQAFGLSVLPVICLFFSFGMRSVLFRLCDTVLPAAYGLYAGAVCFVRISSLCEAYSVSRLLQTAPAIAFTAVIGAVYALLFSVCASYGECRRKDCVTREDSVNCFTYFLYALTAVVLSVVLRDAAYKLIFKFG